MSVGNLEAAVSLLLSTPPESNYFSANALRAVALSSAVSKSLLELAVKVSALGPAHDLKIHVVTGIKWFNCINLDTCPYNLGCCSQHG